MLWLDVFGTPKNPGGVSELLGPRNLYSCNVGINLYLCILGPFRRSKCFG